MSFEGGSICYLTFSDRPLTYSKNSGNNLVSLLFQFFALLTEKTKDHKYQLNASAFGIRNNQLVDILSDDPIV